MQSVILNSTLTAVANTWARGLKLPPQLVHAHILVESGGDPYAWRCEPGYRYLWDNQYLRPFRTLTEEEVASATPPADFQTPPQISTSKTTEWWAQRSSWGPMQVMGAVAREFGFTGNIPQLCDSDGSAGIHMGCLLLQRYANRFGFKGWRAVAAAYNAGSPRYQEDGKTFVNQVYVDKIAAAGGFEGL